KSRGGAGSCLPSIVVVALGEPGVPLTCCAKAGDVASMSSAQAETVSMPALIIVIPRVRTHGASTSSNAQNGFARLSFRATSRCRDSMRPEVNAYRTDTRSPQRIEERAGIGVAWQDPDELLGIAGRRRAVAGVARDGDQG